MKIGKSNTKWVLICAAMISICSLGIGYANWTDSNRISSHVTTSILDFIFKADNENGFKVKLIHNDSNAEDELLAGITYTDKLLNITGIDTSAMCQLLSGAANIQIDYRMVASDLQNGLLQVAEGTYDLGLIPLQLSSASISISSGSRSWVIAVPEVLQKFIPAKIEGLHGCNNVISHIDGVVTGSIIINKLIPEAAVATNFNVANATDVTAVTDVTAISDITLSSLQLSDEINQEIIRIDIGISKEEPTELESTSLESINSESTDSESIISKSIDLESTNLKSINFMPINLDIIANYNFSIPLIFEQDYSIN